MAELGHVGVNFSNPFHHNLKIKSKTTSSFCFFFFFFFARWISLPSSLHQSHLWFAPPPPPNSQTATNRGLFLERVRCVCIHMMDEGDVSHLARKGGERWGRDRWRWREQRLKGWGGGIKKQRLERTWCYYTGSVGLNGVRPWERQRASTWDLPWSRKNLPTGSWRSTGRSATMWQRSSSDRWGMTETARYIVPSN